MSLCWEKLFCEPLVCSLSLLFLISFLYGNCWRFSVLFFSFLKSSRVENLKNPQICCGVRLTSPCTWLVKVLTGGCLANLLLARAGLGKPPWKKWLGTLALTRRKYV